jgi:hypothetical protein
MNSAVSLRHHRQMRITVFCADPTPRRVTQYSTLCSTLFHSVQVAAMDAAQKKLEAQIEALEAAIQRDEDRAWLARERSSYVTCLCVCGGGGGCYFVCLYCPRERSAYVLLCIHLRLCCFVGAHTYFGVSDLTLEHSHELTFLTYFVYSSACLFVRPLFLFVRYFSASGSSHELDKEMEHLEAKVSSV